MGKINNLFLQSHSKYMKITGIGIYYYLNVNFRMTQAGLRLINV
jgi:hypothetical protein